MQILVVLNYVVVQKSTKGKGNVFRKKGIGANVLENFEIVDDKNFNKEKEDKNTVQVGTENKELAKEYHKNVENNSKAINIGCEDGEMKKVDELANQDKDEKTSYGKWQMVGKIRKRLKLKGLEEVENSSSSSNSSSSKSSNDGASVNDTTTTVENSDEEAMHRGGELPTPEVNITSFYDLVKVVKNSNKNLSPQEIENKFKQLSLAFKTDRLTLQQRRIVQQSQIENAETNFTKELNHLKASLLALHENCIDQDINDAVIQVRKHLDVVTLSSSSLLTASEGWGAIQQELSISQAVEVLLLHVENVIRLYESDHQELMEMRKLIDEHDTDLPISPVAATSGQSSSTDSPIAPSRRIRALSLAILSKQQSHEVGSRRISLVPGSSKTVFKDVGGRHSRRRASLMPDLRPYHQELTALAASASCLSKDKTEEKRHSTNGMLKSSITEEGSESGDEVTTNTQAGASESSPMAPSLTNLTDFPVDLYDSSLQDSDQRSDEEVGPSPIHTPTAESHVSNNPATSLAPQSQHWLMVVVEDVLGWVRGGQWPFSLQQTYQGARYAFTSLLLLLAAFFLLLTISSGNDTIHRPCHPGWATVEHVLHPFVTICHAGTPPT